MHTDKPASVTLESVMKAIRRYAFSTVRRRVATGVIALAAVTAIGWIATTGGASEAPGPKAPSTTDTAAQESPEPQRVDAIDVRTVQRQNRSSYPGTLRASQTANLAFRVGGPLVEVNVAPGDHVAEGAVLMRIDPRDYKNAVAAASAQLDAAKAKQSAMKTGARGEDIRALEAKLASAEARKEFARAEFERNTRLLEKNAVAMAEYDASEAELTAAKSDVRAVQEELQKARTGSRREDLDAMEADIRALQTQLKIARDRLEDTELRAPFDGTVTRQLVENHEQVAPGQIAVAMHNIETLEIDISLPEKEILYRQLDKAFDAHVRLFALPGREFTAQFKEINTEADLQTRTYLVTFAMANPEGVNVLPGMVADISLASTSEGANAQGVAAVPVAAVQSDAEGNRFVWVAAEGLVHRRPVELGPLAGDDLYEVRSGLKPGEQVVTGGASFLHEGAQVTVRQKPTASRPSQPPQ